MADIYAAVYSKLSNTSGVTALVSTRIYPEVLPGVPVMPSVTYQLISNVREERHGGQTGDARPRLQITCWDDDALGASAVKEQVRLAMMGMSGSVASVTINGSWNAGETRGYEPDTRRYFASIDFFVAHLEAVA